MGGEEGAWEKVEAWDTPAAAATGVRLGLKEVVMEGVEVREGVIVEVRGGWVFVGVPPVAEDDWDTETERVAATTGIDRVGDMDTVREVVVHVEMEGETEGVLTHEFRLRVTVIDLVLVREIVLLRDFVTVEEEDFVARGMAGWGRKRRRRSTRRSPLNMF